MERLTELVLSTAPAQLELYSTCEALLAAEMAEVDTCLGRDWCERPDARRAAR